MFDWIRSRAWRPTKQYADEDTMFPSVLDRENFVRAFSNWCVISLFRDERSHWCITLESIPGETEIHITAYEPPNIGIFPIRVIPRHPSKKFSRSKFDKTRRRLRSKILALARTPTPSIELLAQCIVAAECCEDICFAFDSSHPFASRVLGTVLKFVVESHAEIARLNLPL